jgi:hypothetical protein
LGQLLTYRQSLEVSFWSRCGCTCWNHGVSSPSQHCDT